MSAIIHFDTGGWRARLDGDFTHENVARVADAAARIWAQSVEHDCAYVAYDARPGARDFAELAARVIAARGIKVYLSAACVPLPALTWALVSDTRSCGGLMITGSHHPIEYLGVKLRMADGGTANTDFNEALEDAVEPEAPAARGSFEELDIMRPYLEHLAASVDGQLISAAHLKVVYDPLYGAGRGCMPKLLKSMGVEVREIHNVPDEERDVFHPEPVEPWVDDCEEAVVSGGAHIGLVTDGDGDRVGAVDENGKFVSADTILALLTGHLIENRGESGRVVINQTSSVLVRRFARAMGCRVTVKPVGFKHIYREIAKGDVLIAGEETGGIACPSYMPERDGLFAALLLCELMAKTGKPLGVLVEELESAFGKMRHAKKDIRLEAEEIETFRMMVPGLNPETVAGMQPTTVSHMDGLKLEFADGSWILLRPSREEPVVRIHVEAETVEKRDILLEKACDLARGEKID